MIPDIIKQIAELRARIEVLEARKTRGPTTDLSERVLAFWNAYPQVGRERSGRPQVLKAWKAQKCDDLAPGIISGALANWIKSEAWTKDAGVFIPGAHRWIQKRSWETEPRAAGSNGKPRLPYHQPLPPSEPTPAPWPEDA